MTHHPTPAGQRTLDPSRPDDLTQETMLRVFKNLRKYDPERSTGWGWCRAILRNVFLDWLRREKHRAALSLNATEPVACDDPTAAAELADEIEKLGEAIENL